MNSKYPALLLAFGLASCTKDQNLMLTERTVTNVDTTSAAAEAKSADGLLTLTFERGALSAPTEITIETHRDVSLPRVQGRIKYELGPSDATFATPVKIVITGARSTTDELAIANLDGDYPEALATSQWDSETGVASAELAHFSSYGVVALFNPCAGKSCGDSCTICDPLDVGCTEPAPTAKQCNRSDLCVDVAAVMCTTPPAPPPPPPPPTDGGAGEGIIEDFGPPPADPDAGPAPDALETLDATPTSTTCSDSFSQNVQPIVDILLVVDNSCSMFEEQASLANSFNLLLDVLQNNRVDFHIGVTTTDVDPTGAQGALVGNPTILDPATPNISTAFAANVMTGTDGSGFEQGLEASLLALSPPMSTGANAGFIRDLASLVIIYLSDENDGSPQAAASYVSFFQSIHGPDRVQANAIVGDSPNGCSGSGGFADSGSIYDIVRAATGGAFSSICTPPWILALTDLGGPGFGYLRSFRLAQPAPAGTISVEVDGVVIPQMDAMGTHWTYDEATQTVTFGDLSIPEPGSVIVVRSGC